MRDQRESAVLEHSKSRRRRPSLLRSRREDVICTMEKGVDNSHLQQVLRRDRQDIV
jgi:hypothetical protein